MADARVERRLAAILAADVVGYSRLMGVDEEGTLAALKACRRDVVDPIISDHRGRIFKTTGDGALVEFASAVDAVRCAMEIQLTMVGRNSNTPEDRQIEFRIGINVGDIIFDEGDIYGEGVNIASRIETLASPGTVCVSDSAYQQIKGKLAVDVSDLGEQKLKNIMHPVRVYAVRFDDRPPIPQALALPDKPSIAVLPFTNMSGDVEQEYFADGIVEDIITALSRMGWLFVIARNSSFTYKGRSVDVKQVGRDLGVRYVLEGSIRKATNRVRITGQLIDTATGAHLWGDRFDGALEDIFDLQDQVTTSVVGAIAPKLEQAEIERAKRKPTESLDAYDYFLRGLSSVHVGSKDAIAEAIQLFNRAIGLDPEFSSAYGMAAWCYARRKANSWIVEQTKETAEAGRLAWHAVEFGKNDAVALCTGGFVLGYLGLDIDRAIPLIDRSLILNPNLATAWLCSGWVTTWNGDSESAIARFDRAMRLSPLDPQKAAMQAGTALAYLLSGRFDQACLWAENAIREQPNYLPAVRVAPAAHALAGRDLDAQKALARLRQLEPAFVVDSVPRRAPFRRPEDVARYQDGLRRAGLPESQSDEVIE